MMSNSIQKRRGKLLRRAVVAILITVPSLSQGAVSVVFEQIGSDIKVSWDGTLSLDNTIASSATEFTGFQLSGFSNNSNYGYASSENYYSTASVGSYTDATSLNYKVSTNSGGSSTFGFSGTSLVYGTDNLTGGTHEAVSELSFDSSVDYFFITGTTLSAEGADGFNNDVFWQANTTNDTIAYTSVSSVPEPSSAFLCAVSIMGGLFLRKREETKV